MGLARSRVLGPIAALALALAAIPAAAQGTVAVLIVDRERALSESAPAAGLGAQERAARVALKAELDELRASLEAEEGEIAAMREIAPKEVFEARVRAFDARVREARRESQEKGEALQARFVAARRQLVEALEPVLRELLAETGAVMIVDARSVLAAQPGADMTEEVIRRFNARASVALPPPPPRGARSVGSE
ncbi:MAG: OmpH family outer membrane protein [Pikeienuella sp.]